MLTRLVAFDTTSALSNLALIDFVEGYAAAWGARCRRTFNEEGSKANLFVTIGPDFPGGIVLSGHSDVVPVTGQIWQSDPFTLTQRDGRLYGRGSADMKGFIASALALLPEMAAADLKRPIHFAISHDEEISCLGVKSLIEDVCKSLPRPAMVLIGEPTNMAIANAHKGAFGWDVSITGKAAHSSQTQLGANSIFAAARIIRFLEEKAEDYKTNSYDEAFEPPYSTVSVGQITGGSARNIVPNNCSFAWDLRCLPDFDVAGLRRNVGEFIEMQVLPDLRRNFADAKVKVEECHFVPPLKAEKDGAAEALLRRLTGLNHSIAVSYATEGGWFQDAGFSTVICGPGAIQQAHQADEYIEISQLEACDKLLRKILTHSCED
jgi:acetylornithine deacetylase